MFTALRVHGIPGIMDFFDYSPGASGMTRPQPVRGQARLSLALPAAGELSLRVHDVAGRQVATLASGRWPVGRHDVRWHAREASSGVYFVWARLDGFGERSARVLVTR